MPTTVGRRIGAAFRSPKTILGFFNIALGVVAAAAVAAVATLAKVPALHWLIPAVLGFVAILAVLVLASVLITAWKDPTILMLGEVSGHAYIENRRLTLGDSSLGERVEEIQVERPDAAQPPLLQQPKQDDSA